MKNKKFACYCCNVHRDNLLTHSRLPCEDCIWLNETKPYFHQAISDEILMAQLAEEYVDLLHQWPHLMQYPFKLSCMWCGRECLAMFRSENRHIEYDYAGALLNARVQYLQLLEKELQMRNVQLVG